MKISLILILIFFYCNSATAKTLLSSWSDLTLVGGFSVPATLINGYNTRYATGSFDKLPGSKQWVANHGLSGYVVEYTEPSEPNMSFPTLVVGRHGHPFAGKTKITTPGVQWIDADNVICSVRRYYSSGGFYDWVSLLNLNTGVEKLQTVGNVDTSVDWAEGSSSNKLFHLHQSFGGGFTRIPSDWATVNLSGKTVVGMAAGGYDVLNSPMGPAVGAFEVGDTLPITLMDYPIHNTSSDGKDHFEVRDKNYWFPVYSSDVENTPIHLWKWSPDYGEVQSDPQLMGPTGDNGYFTAEVVSSGAGWIDDPNYKGLVFGVLSPNGYIDYSAQSVPGAGEMFLVYDPSTFYSEDSNTGKIKHWLHTEYADGPSGSYSNKLYVYDPDCFAQVADGTIDEWECSPTIITPDFSNLPINPVDRDRLPTSIAGVFWDEDRSYLWLVLTQMSNGNKYPMLVAYELGTTRPAIINMKIK